MSATQRLRRRVAPLVKNVLKLPADALILSSHEIKRRIDDQISQTTAHLNNPGITAKFYPLAAADSELIVAPDGAVHEVDENGLAVPPVSLFEGYGNTATEYLASGREHHKNMLRIVSEQGFCLKAGQRILDFGCAAGRLIRWFAPWAKQCEIRGVDINAKYVLWCQQNLTPFHFTATTTFPHLPFEDNYFDLIYSGSVFTHISDLADSWLMELRRVLKPKGLLYATIHDETTIQVLRQKYPEFFLTRLVDDFDERNGGILKKGFSFFSLCRSPQHAMVFYDSHYLKQHWGKEFSVLTRSEEAYGFQSGYVLQKRPQTGQKENGAPC